MAVKGSYDIAGMRSAAGKIEECMGNYQSNKTKMIDLVAATRQHTDDPIVRDYLQKFENLKKDMESVQNLMKAYADYLREAATVIEKATTV